MGKLALLALASLLAASAAQAQSQPTAKVSTLIPATTPFNGSELLYIVQGGMSKQTPVTTFQSQFATNYLPLAGGTLTGLLRFGVLAPLGLTGGNQTGTAPWFGLLGERAPGSCSSIASGLWSGNTAGLLCFSDLATAATDPTGAVAGNPRWLVLLNTVTQDTILNPVSLGIVNLSYATGAKITGINTIIGGNNADVPNETTHVEMDFQGVTNASVLSQGLEMQAFNGITASVGFRFTANGSGTFNLGGDFSGAMFNTAAVKFGANQPDLLFEDASGSHPLYVRTDGSDDMEFFSGGTARLFTFGDGGTNHAFVMSGSSNNYVQTVAAANGSAPFLEAIAGGTDASANLGLEAFGSGGSVILVSNGVNALTAGPSSVALLQPLGLDGPFSVAGTPLPTCNSGLRGAVTYVTDATARSTTYTGSGAVVDSVFCNGSAWLTQ